MILSKFALIDTSNQIESLVERCRRHDVQAQNALYHALFGYVYTICFRYVANEEETKEAVQDVFFKAFTKLQYYQGAPSFHAWIKKIAVNTCIDRFRTRSKVAANIELTDVADSGFAPEALVDADADYLLYLISKLPFSYRTAFNMFAVDGFKYEEIAAQLGVAVGTVSANISKARRILQQQISTNHDQKAYL